MVCYGTKEAAKGQAKKEIPSIANIFLLQGLMIWRWILFITKNEYNQVR